MRRLLLPLLLFATIARAADPLPTMDDLKAKSDAADWPGLLAGTSRALALHGGPLTKDYRRPTLWNYKAEALLHSGQMSVAADAFASVAAEPDATAAERDLALSNAMLLHLSTPSGYKPNLARPEGQWPVYDVIDPARRTDARAALLANELADLSPRVTAMAKGPLRPDPLLKLLKKVVERQPLERAVTGGSGKFDDLEHELAQSFVDHIDAWHDTNLPVLLKFEALARQPDTSGATASDTPGQAPRRGLTQTEQSQVRRILDEAATHGREKGDLSNASSELGRAVLKGAEGSIKEIYDKGHAVLTLGQVPRKGPRKRSS